MNIAVSGGTGFLGSHIVDRLLDQGHSLFILKRSTSDTWRLEKQLERIQTFDIDTVDLNEIFKNVKIDGVVHAATDYGRGAEYYTDIVKANLVFPLNLLDVSLRNDVQFFINTDTFISRETVKVDYLSSYQLSKRQFFEWAALYCHDIKFLNFRLEHLYGPKDNDSKFVVQIIHSLLNNENFNATEGKQKRDFIYVTDAAHAYSVAIENISQFEGGVLDIELGTGESISIRNFMETARTICSSTSEISFGALPYRDNEVMDSIADIKVLTDIGWKPEVTIEEGIRKTINFEQERLQK